MFGVQPGRSTVGVGRPGSPIDDEYRGMPHPGDSHPQIRGHGVHMRCAAPHQRGQTLPVVVLFMFSLVGMCAIAIDIGSWHQEKRAAQSAAGASALAGVAVLPVSWSSAQSKAASEFTLNKKAADTAT